MQRTLTVAAMAYQPDGSGYYRLFLPISHCAEKSRHVIGMAPPGVRYARPEDLVGPNGERCDVLAVQRPVGPDAARMLENLVGKVKVVYECDDNMLEVDPAGLPWLYDERTRESVRYCLRLCDMVTVSNEYLRQVFLPYNDNIRVLPNHVKAGLLTLNRPKRDRLVVGWAGGTTHLVDMVTVAEPLHRVLADHPEVDMHFMGCDFSPLLGMFNPSMRDRCRWSGWQRDVGEYYKRVDFDIAVAPSADIPFNRSKTWIRALEMAAMGVPIVAQNRLPYSEFVVDGKTGFLVDSAADWEARLDQLIGDPDLRAEMGAAGKEQAAGWTIEDGWRLWEAAYEEVAG